MDAGRVPFRVEDSRRWILGSIAGHVGFTLLFSLLGAALLSPPPPLQVVRVNLQTMELPSDETPAVPAAEERAEPEVVEEPEPEPPREVEMPATTPTPDESPEVREDPAPVLEPVAPEFELPREAQPVEAEPEELDLPEPAAVQAERSDPEPASAAEPEEVSAGATVQATATEGIDDTYLRLVQQKVGRGWRPTDASTRGLREVSCVVSFRIGAAGQVIAPTVTTSSGLSVFDRRALASVERAAPLPAPPTRFGGSGVEIDFRFSYSR